MVNLQFLPMESQRSDVLAEPIIRHHVVLDAAIDVEHPDVLVAACCQVFAVAVKGEGVHLLGGGG